MERIHLQTYGLTGGIHVVRNYDDLSCHDIRTKFHKGWFRRGHAAHTDTMETA
jgi:hypothetical protein